MNSIAEPEGLWVVHVEWVSSSPTHHGPFQFADEAEAWARNALDDDDACVQWEVGSLTPPPTWRPVRRLAEHTAAAQARVLELAGAGEA